jgi:hypothetical protein
MRTKHEKSPLRTKDVEGFLAMPPVVGCPLAVVGESIDPTMSVRSITTSTVLAIHWDQTGCHLETLNSVYDLRINVTEDNLLELQHNSLILEDKIKEQEAFDHSDWM